MDKLIEKKAPTIIVSHMYPTDSGLELKITEREVPSKKDNAGLNLESLVLTTENQGDTSITIRKEQVQQILGEHPNQEIRQISDDIVSIFDQHEDTITNKDPAAAVRGYENSIPNQAAAIRRLISIKDLFSHEAEILNAPSHLFNKNVDHENAFGVTKSIMDALQYLPNLLNGANLVLPEKGSNTYTITSTTQTGFGLIGLEHILWASNESEAKKCFLQYHKDMQSGALQVLLALWAQANDAGAFEFPADITDIINKIKGAERDSYITDKEKERFWSECLLLQDTKLTITIDLNNQVIEMGHRLLDIPWKIWGKGKNGESKKKGSCPTKIIARVLDPDAFKQKATRATEISKGTLKLDPKDILLSLSIQIRRAQKPGSSTYDEAYLIERANLKKTFDANPRVGRKRLHEKLDRIKKAKALDDYKTRGRVIDIKHRPTKKKSKEK